MASAVLHLVSAVGGLLRVEHVCGRGCGEFPQVPRVPGGRGEGEEGRETSSSTREETAKYETKMRCGFVIGGCSSLGITCHGFVDLPWVWLDWTLHTHAYARMRTRAMFAGFEYIVANSFFFFLIF